MIIPTIAFTNESTVLKDPEIQAIIPALQSQVSSDFRHAWDVDCKLLFLPKGQPLPAGYWQIIVLDNPDQAGALGYHEVTSGGNPLGKIFAKLDIDDGHSWTVTTSHELLEMLADPYINWCAQGENGEIYALEVSDPVESDALAYHINGVLVSDFITPGWFGPAEQFKPDFKGHLTKRLQLASGGYVSILGRHGWTQIQGEGLTVPVPKGSRRDRRNLPKAQWKRSER
jgi:hypothetical protein